ncbi:MAG: Gfo/Idh/MocA family oxidoreductase [Deinococcus sp.]|nr:Gfo/Idh/MocA family oxidoreductase [Deinococcus sp.]
MIEIPVGVIGYGMMGKAHSRGYALMNLTFEETRFRPVLAVLCGRTKEKLHKRAAAFGFQRAETDWRAVVGRKELQVIDNCGPDPVHVEPTLAALAAGKHLVCEKPLALTAEGARRLRDVALKAKVHHLCGFNYRFLPGMMLMKQLLQAQVLGPLHQLRAAFLEDPITNPDVFGRHQAGDQNAGATSDLGCHVVDLVRWLVGEPVRVSARARDMVRGPRALDDLFVATMELENGAIGTLEASKFATGRRSYLTLEIYGERGGIAFDLSDLNYVFLHLEGEQSGPVATPGWRRIDATNPQHPYASFAWGTGHGIGWADSFTCQLYEFLAAVAGEKGLFPWYATFEDGYRAAVITEALAQSAATGESVAISYNPPAPST